MNPDILLDKTIDWIFDGIILIFVLGLAIALVRAIWSELFGGDE